MSKILVALAAAASLAVGLAATATTANAQADYWNGGWHVGGDYYQPTDYGYGYLSDYGQPAGGYSAIATVAPVRTVETIETVRTIRPARTARRQIVTRQTTISQVAYPRTLYDYAGPATAIAAPAYNTAGYYNANATRPLYDYAGPATAIAAPPTVRATLARCTTMQVRQRRLPLRFTIPRPITIMVRAMLARSTTP